MSHEDAEPRQSLCFEETPIAAFPLGRWVVLILVGIPSVIWSAGLVVAVLIAGQSYDWWTFEEASARIGTGRLYDWSTSGDGWNYAYRYSPLFAWLMVPITALGLGLWRILHLAALLLLPRRLALIALLAWPFWEDVWHANVLTFAAVLGYLALRGSRWAAWGSLVLALLVPRPLALPLLAYLAWKRPEWRLGGVVIIAVITVLTLATGEASQFLQATARSGEAIDYPLNLSPSRFIGVWWLAVGVPLAAWLTYSGRVGLASLAISPYVLPYYLLTLMWEPAFVRRERLP